MRRRKIFWQIFPTIITVTLAVLFAITWVTTSSLRQFYLEQVHRDLHNRATLVRLKLEGSVDTSNQALQNLCDHIGETTSTRVTLILLDGTVVADSHEHPKNMNNHASREEVRAILNGQNMSSSIRYSTTLKERMMYVAQPLNKDENLHAVIRVALSVAQVDQNLWTLISRILFSGTVIAVLAAFFSVVLARGLSRPLENIKDGAARFAQGDLDFSLSTEGPEETRSLAAALNQMSQELRERMATINHQSQEQETIFSSMSEGVMAINNSNQIIHFNHAAGALLKVPAYDQQVGRAAPEVVRHSGLLKFIERVQKKQRFLEEDIVFEDPHEKVLQVSGTPLIDPQKQRVGSLIVLSDVTRLKKLEKLRRDFVANVSHELRTPITSIKGFIETLLDGAMDEKENARRFLEKAGRHADRLNAIIEDLLSLSRLEQDEEHQSAAYTREDLKAVVANAVQLCEVKAQKKQSRVKVEVAEGLMAELNAPLMEQAIVNLLDNAIKYSPEMSTVTITAQQEGDDLVVCVSDNGPGIASEHLGRLFERFYRIDKARSRSEGGTGLGLALVKHIIGLHGGSVSVESQLGQGSRFCLKQPLLQSEGSQ